MSLSYLLSLVAPTFSPIYNALVPSHIPFNYRWRLLLLQPLGLLTVSLKVIPHLFSRSFTLHYIPTRSGRVRALVFQPQEPTRSLSESRTLRPLHLDIHGGGFLGGVAEYDAPFCTLLAQATGTVVISTEYRPAPRCPFPAAIGDIDDVIVYLFENAERLWGADRNLFTVSGFSAGGNLALAASQQEICQPPSVTNIKAAVTFYNPVDLRLPPGKKLAPPNYPKSNPIAFVDPLFEAYPRGVSCDPKTHADDPRLHPILADLATLPRDMLFIIPEIDILQHEQLSFVERLRSELSELPEDRREDRKIEGRIFKECFHGWLELPSGAINEQTRTDAFNAGIDLIRSAHQKYGWHWTSN